MQNVYSVDTLSLLSGSSTFNHFARVFDQFKVQSVHLCIDLAEPATSYYEMKVLYTLPLDENFDAYGYKIFINDVVQVYQNVDAFKTALKGYLTDTFYNDENDYIDTNLDESGLFQAFLIMLTEGSGCCISETALTSSFATKYETVLPSLL